MSIVSLTAIFQFVDAGFGGHSENVLAVKEENEIIMSKIMIDN